MADSMAVVSLIERAMLKAWKIRISLIHAWQGRLSLREQMRLRCDSPRPGLSAVWEVLSSGDVLPGFSAPEEVAVDAEVSVASSFVQACLQRQCLASPGVVVPPRVAPLRRA